MNQPHLAHRLARPAVLSLARREAALKDAARRLRRWPREGARPSLTAAPRLAVGCSGRDGKTALQPNRKTAMAVGDWRTTHALQKADMFTRHRHADSADSARTSRLLSNLQEPESFFEDRAAREHSDACLDQRYQPSAIPSFFLL